MTYFRPCCCLLDAFADKVDRSAIPQSCTYRGGNSCKSRRVGIQAVAPMLLSHPLLKARAVTETNAS